MIKITARKIKVRSESLCSPHMCENSLLVQEHVLSEEDDIIPGLRKEGRLVHRIEILMNKKEQNCLYCILSDE